MRAFPLFWLHFAACHKIALCIISKDHPKTITNRFEATHGSFRTLSKPSGTPEKNAEKELAKGAKHVENQINRTVDAPKTSYELARNDSSTMLEIFMPGYAFNGHRSTTIVLWVVASSVWFLIYFHKLYTSDRAEDLDHWESRLREREATEAYKAMSEQKKKENQIAGDLILVFHHPGFDHSDGDSFVAPELLERCFSSHSLTRLPPNISRKLLGNADTESPLKRPIKLSGYPEYDYPEQPSPSESDTAEEIPVLGRCRSPREEAKRLRKAKRDQPSCKEVTYREARFALLQDMYAYLHQWGFEVQLFSSIADDAIFLCVSLLKEEALEHYMIRSRMRFQLQPEIVEKLGILHPQDEHASSPPLLPYNPKDVDMLHKADLIETSHKDQMYKCEFGHRRGSDHCIVTSSERIHLIYHEMCTVFDLDAARSSGFLSDWYPAHENRKRLDRIYTVWADFRLLLDISMVQPIPKIHSYFGNRVAFNFSWNGTYCKCLLALLPVAVFTSVATHIPKSAHTQELSVLSSTRVLGFSMVLALWSRIAHNVWLRERSFFTELFDADVNDASDLNSHFHGTPEPSPVDLNKMEIQYPRWKSLTRQTVSMFATLSYSTFVGFMAIAFMHRAIANNAGVLSIWALIYFVAQLKIFQFVYNYLASALTVWENHKYHRQHYNSLLWKQILFQFVNYYVPFLYLIVSQRFSSGCPEQGCLAALQFSLNFTLVLLGVFRVVEVIFEACHVRYRLQSELATASSEESSQHSFLEEQSKYPAYRQAEQIETMLELVLALGYVLIFGAVAFGTVLFCFLVFFIQLRANAFYLTTYARRPLPRASVGIGGWEDVVELIQFIGVLFEGFLIVNFDASFDGTPPVTKLMGIVSFWLVVACMWGVVDSLWFPHPDAETALLRERRKYTVNKFMQKTGHLLSATRSTMDWTPPQPLSLDDCLEVPHFDGTSVESWRRSDPTSPKSIERSPGPQTP